MRRLQVTTERLFDDHARPTSEATGRRQVLDDDGERGGRNGQIVQRSLRVPERLAQPVEGARVVVVARDQAEQRRELFECCLIEAPISDEAGTRPLDETVERSGSRDAEHRDGESTPSDEPLQGGEDFLVGQITRDAVDDERVGWFSHRAILSRRLDRRQRVARTRIALEFVKDARGFFDRGHALTDQLERLLAQGGQPVHSRHGENLFLGRATGDQPP